MYFDQITHCMTIGRRPDLLQKTLLSLQGLPAMRLHAVNDFGDIETNEMLMACVPDAKLVDLGRKAGHHPAVDALYATVETPYIFHNEDDWGFSRCDFLDAALRLLDTNPALISVCLRDTQDMPLSAEDRAKVLNCSEAGITYQRLDHLHDQWHGYTFNPHVIRKSVWTDLGGYSQFEKERHISRHLRAKGGYVAFLTPASCSHIGDGQSTHLKPPSLFKRFKTWYRGL